MKIFLAYSSADKGKAESIALALRARRHSVFFDRDDLPAGTSYNQRIEHAIQNSDIFVFLVSPASVKEGSYARTELKFARQKWLDPAGHVLPVRVRATPARNIPPYLAAVTILETEGNLAAETSAAVGRMRRGTRGRDLERPAADVSEAQGSLSRLMSEVAGFIVGPGDMAAAAGGAPPTLHQKDHAEVHRKRIVEVLNACLDLKIALMDPAWRNNLHLGIMIPMPQRGRIAKLTLVAASRILRDSQAMGFAMARGEGVGGAIWKEWETDRRSRTRSLARASERRSYISKRLKPPADLSLSKQVSQTGVCVTLPAADERFLGILCLGSSTSADARQMAEQKTEGMLVDFARMIAPFAVEIARR
jgi:hypothetical protein